MIKIVTKENKKDCADLVDQMHFQRFQIFVKGLGWDLNHKNHREYDEYDTDDAVYLLSVENEKLMGSIRLLPSTSPHLLYDHFSFLCENGVPIGPQIWEATRAYSRPAEKEPLALNKTMGELFCAMLEFALLRGIEHYTVVGSLVIMPVVLYAGWNVIPLGLPKTLKGDRVGAFSIEVSPESLQKLRLVRGVGDPVINYLGAPNFPVAEPILRVSNGQQT